MSEITLQKYYAKLEDFLQQQRNDEVVQHSRHILRTFPRNVRAFRLLGNALANSGQYDDAERALRRVLRVYPADQWAHLGLSRIAEHRRDGPAVIWHLERAYEQDPTDPKIQEAMRDAYRQYRKTELTRLPLTARLIAHQQIRSGLYPKAISTLRAALNQLPTRIDLQVLLAQALWEAGYEVQAGETALQILKSLPESLEANDIMTRLWLREGRPSDAQRYLSRIEAVDPLYAYEVAQGTAAPDNIFRLSEFNYQVEANRQLVSDSPDWLDSLGPDPDSASEVSDSLDNFSLNEVETAAAGEASDDDWLASAFSLDEFDEDTEVVPELDAGDMTPGQTDDDDWMSALEMPPPAPVTEISTLSTEAEDEASADDGAWIDILNEVQSTASNPTREVSNEDLDQLFGNKQDFDELLAEVDNAWTPEEELWTSQNDDWFTQNDTSNAADNGGSREGSEDDKVSTPVIPSSGRTGLTGLLSSLDEPSSGSTGLTGLLDSMDDSTELSMDELAPGSHADDWMRDVNKPTTRLEPANLPDSENFADDFEPVDNSLSWLGTSADEVELPEASDYDPDDSLAWMRDTGIEFMEDAPASALDAAFASDADELQGPVMDPHMDNPLAWASGLGLEFVESDTGNVRQFEELADTTRGDDTNAADSPDDLSKEESLAWMSDAGVTWLVDDTTVDTASDNFTFTEQDGQGAMNDENNDRTPDWLSSNNEDGDSFSASDFGADDFEADLFGTTESETGDDSLDWLNMLEDENAGASENAVPANSSGPTSGSASFDDEFSELDRALGLDSVPESGGEEVLPDWLLASRPDQAAGDTPSDEESFDESLFDEPTMASVADDLEMAWGAENTGAGVEFSAEEFEASEVGETDEEQVPDWLSALNPAPAENAATSDFEMALDEFDSSYEESETENPLFAMDALSDWSQDRDEDGGLIPFDSVNDGMPSGLDSGFDFDTEADLLSRASAADADSGDREAESYSSFGSFDTSADAMDEEIEAFDFEFSDSADSNDEISQQAAATGENLPDWLLEIGDQQNEETISMQEEETPQQEEIPSWLQNAAPAEAAATNANEFDLNFDTSDDNAASAFEADTLDDELWELDEEDVAAAPAAETTGWLNDVTGDAEADEMDEAEEFDFNAASSGQPSFSTTDYQSDFGDFGNFGEFETEAENTEIRGTSEVPAWLSALDEDQEEEDEGAQITAPDPISDLEIASDQGIDEDFESEFGYDSGDDLMLDVDELETQLPDTIVADGETLDRELDWMLEDDEEEPEFVAQFGDLPRLEDSDNDEEVFSLEPSTFETDMDFENSEEDDLRGLDLEEEIEPVPASNAPDWLNAMVPGLDLDYEAEPTDDEFSDEFFATEDESPAVESTSGSYAWVNEIVEEELRPPMTMPEPVRATSEAAAVDTSMVEREERRSRFTFNRAPVWLRRLRGEPPAVLGSASNGGTEDRDTDVYNNAGAAGAAGVVGAGLAMNDLDLTDSDVADFDEDLFDDEVFNTADTSQDDIDFDLDEDSMDEFDELDDFDDLNRRSMDASSTSFDADFDDEFGNDFNSSFDADDDLELNDEDETDLPPWLRLDGDD
jgi:tetratricopeptide (TPR) repeat protein